MRIAVVSPYDLAVPGGVQDQVVALVEGLRSDGHEAWAVAPGSGGPPGSRHVGPTVAVPVNRSRAPISLDPRVGGAVASAVADADVVHVHEPLVPMVSLGAVMRARPPLVVTFHADPSPVVRRMYRRAGGVLRRVLRRAAVVTAVSEVAASAVAHLTDLRIVPNGIDVGSFPTGPVVPGRVAFLGRDEPRKGLAVLLQAWPLARAGRPERELRVMGASREQGPLGVTFLGRVDGGAKRRELAAAEVFCAPNLGGESFGIVIVEAMAAGCAVVASSLDSFRAVGADAACYVPPGDPTVLAEAIGGLLDDPARTSVMAAAATERAAGFDLGEVRASYLAAYRDAAPDSR